MQLTLSRVERDNRTPLENLFQLYLNEIAPFYDHLRLGPDGRYPDEQLARYFGEAGHHPWLVHLDGKLAGFVLMRFFRRDGREGHSIDEFYIHREYRRRRAGALTAARLFTLYPGRWEIGVVDANASAVAFWEKTIRGVCGDDFHEHRNPEAWPGPLFMFTVPVRSRGSL